MVQHPRSASRETARGRPGTDCPAFSETVLRQRKRRRPKPVEADEVLDPRFPRGRQPPKPLSVARGTGLNPRSDRAAREGGPELHRAGDPAPGDRLERLSVLPKAGPSLTGGSPALHHARLGAQGRPSGPCLQASVLHHSPNGTGGAQLRSGYKKQADGNPTACPILLPRTVSCS